MPKAKRTEPTLSPAEPETIPQDQFPPVQVEPEHIASTPIKVVDLTTEIKRQADPVGTSTGRSFWFGQVGRIQFDDKGRDIYLATKQREYISDPVLIEKLLKHAEANPSAAIFPE